MVVIVILILPLITFIFYVEMKKMLSATTVSAIFNYLILIIARYKELQEIKKSNMDLENG